MTEQESVITGRLDNEDDEQSPQESSREEQFWGGLSEEGERLAGQLKVILEEQGYVLEAGIQIPQSVIREALISLEIKSDFWMAMVAPPMLKKASGGLEAHWDIKDDKGVYSLK